MKINEYIKQIKKLSACEVALKDALNYESSQDLWSKCERGDWMLWLLRRVLNLNDETILRRFTLAKARCARLVFYLMKDEKSRNAVEVADSFGNGIATREELNAASDASAYAAYAASDAADAADAAASAAYAASAARKGTLKKCSDIVRELYPEIDIYLENDMKGEVK